MLAAANASATPIATARALVWCFNSDPPIRFPVPAPRDAVPPRDAP
jgi:hypothetical protein